MLTWLLWYGIIIKWLNINNILKKGLIG